MCGCVAIGLRSSNTGSGGKGDRHDVDGAAGEKRERRRNKDKEFWSRLGNVIDEKKLRVWDALERSLHRYNAVLEERSHLIQETKDIREQNAHLKVLLEQYLSAKINDELNVPPTHVIDFPKF